MMIQTTSSEPLRTFRAGQIATSIGDAVTIELHEEPEQAATRLESRRFDQAPVMNQNHVYGWVRTDRLQAARNVKSVVSSLETSAIVSAEATIADVLDLLAEEGFVFTVNELGIAGFIAPSDLDRHAARGHFYLLIASLEMALANIVQSTTSEEEITARIRDDSLERWMEALALGKEASPIEYLYLEDLADLFRESGLVRRSPDAWEPTLTELCKFRPAVMHPTRPLVAGGSTGSLASLARRGEELLTRLADLAKSL